MVPRKEIMEEINMLEEEIQILELKRSRSQAALIEALISRQDPPEAETQYFRAYSAEIDVKRSRIVDLMEQLKN